MVITYLFAKDDLDLLPDFAAISVSFFALSNVVWLYYKKVLSKNKENLALKFLMINMLKDVVWAMSLGYYFKSSQITILYLVIVFIFGSVPLYTLLIQDLNKINSDSDKNQF